MVEIPKTWLPRLNHLRAFDSVAVAGAMSAAANKLHLTQPAITRSVRELEGALGAKLFQRTAGGSFLTEEGQIFSRRVSRFLRQIEEAIGGVVGCDADSEDVSRLLRKISDGQLRSLLAISESGNFRRAARKLDVREPTLHRSARELEHLLGVSLYRVMPSGVGLSPTGTELARRIAVAVNEIRAGLDELALHRGAGATHMTIGLLRLAPKHLLAKVTVKVLERHPRARLTLREGGYEELIEAMRNGEVDLVFGALRSPPPYDDLSEEALFEDPYCVVCRRGHPLARVHRPTRTILKKYDWVFPTAPQPRRAVLDQFIATLGLPSEAHIETNSAGAVTAALAVSNRLSLLPRGYILGGEQSDQLVILDVPVPHPTRMVGLTTRRDWLPTALHADVMAQLRAATLPRNGGRAGRRAPAMVP